MSDIWSHDPGYRPEDPRYGLSPKQLLDYYDARPTQWLIRSTYGPEGLARRNGALAAHRDYLFPRRDRIYFLGPILADDGKTPIGSWMMMEAPSRADALAFIAGEGFVQAGMIEAIDIHRFIETSATPRRQLEIRTDPDLQLFLCEMTDGPDGAEKRKGAAAAHQQYQEQVRDKLVAHGPMRSDDNRRAIGTFYIVQAKDRAAAEKLVADEPLNRAGVFSRVRVDRWRFGGAIADEFRH